MTRIGVIIAGIAMATLAACSADEKPVSSDFAFDGTCTNCHLGLSGQHAHPNFKLRCIDCHGGNDQAPIPEDATDVGAGDPTAAGKFRDPELLKQAHVFPKDPKLARFFFANGVDDNGDGKIDDPFLEHKDNNGIDVLDNLGEAYEPGLHGEGPGEFVDAELNRDLDFTRFLNPGDLRTATIGCGSRNRAALDAAEQGNGGSCHQETVDVVRRLVMVNQSAVTNGAYYGNESWRQRFIDARGNTPDPRAGAFGYVLDYNAADACIDTTPVDDGVGGRKQPHFDHQCAEANAVADDPSVDTNAPGNAGLPPFEIAEGPLQPPDGNAVDKQGNKIDPGVASDPATTIAQTFGAGQSRYPWGGQTVVDVTAERANFNPIPNEDLSGLNPLLAGVPDPVDLILRTFRAYYPLNYPGSITNQNFTFGQSIEPDIDHFKTSNPFGRAHASGCAACHSNYNYDGSRNPQHVLCNGDDATKIVCKGVDDGSFVDVVDPTTKHREFDASMDVPVPADQAADGVTGQVLRGRAVKGVEQVAANSAQMNAYSSDHNLTTAITTDQCGLCHGFVTRINYAYQGEAEEEQREQLSRRAPTVFSTPGGTQVQILDSWVRQDIDLNTKNSVVVKPADGLAVIAAAKQRDADLAKKGFIPGNGGCALNQFTEDCNNNGELDTNLVLNKFDENGNIVDTITINEDANNNGKLDLVDRLPRENSIDGRQVRYIYGGRNGSTHLMDIHFEKGMHCIDCHFLQDVHGDGHIYSTNWDHIEIECEDCHGSANLATLKTSGPTGGNDLTKAHDANGIPYFENKNGKIIQRSRVTPGLFWIVPQTKDQTDDLAKEAHINNPHISEPGQGSTFADPSKPGQSKLTNATVECAACHSSWIHNCTGCHVNANIGDLQRLAKDDEDGLFRTAHENEIWFTNLPNPGHIDFQLLGQLRAPFVLGVSSSSESGRLETFRSSMQAMASLTDQNTNQFAENVSFTTFQAVDGNSGRQNVATSGVAMNQTMPHTVRPHEARGCEMCHTLVDNTGKARNEHILAETFGLGVGALSFAGDFGIAVGANGLEMYEYKQDNELAGNKFRANKNNHSWFPGLIVNGNDRNNANVEPIFDGSQGITAGSVATDVVFIRTFNKTPDQPGGTQPPSLQDLVVMGVNAGGAGKLVITNTLFRGVDNVAGVVPVARKSVGDTTQTFVLNLPAPPRGVSHLAPDVSDPFVYVADTTAGVVTVRLDDAVGTATPAVIASTTPLPNGQTAKEIVQAGDELYVGTVEGTVVPFDLSDPEHPVAGTPFNVGQTVQGFALAGFVLYGITDNGVFALDLDDPQAPDAIEGAAANGNIFTMPGATQAHGIAVSQGHLYIAAGTAAGNGGVLDLDVRTAAAPISNGNVMTSSVLAGVDAQDVQVSTMPGQVWLLILSANGDLGLQKLDNRKSKYDLCWPDPKGAGCTLDLKFYDATQSGRDPSFDPNTNTFDDPVAAKDPSAVDGFLMPHKIITSGVHLAKGAYWEQLGTLTGRRYRDSFMPGSGVMSFEVMQRMRNVLVCETTGDSRAPGNLGALGYPDAGGGCKVFAPSVVPNIRKPKKQKKQLACVQGDGKDANVCRPADTTTRMQLQLDTKKPANTSSAGPAVGVSTRQ